MSTRRLQQVSAYRFLHVRPICAQRRTIHVTSIDPSATLMDTIVQDHKELKRYYENYKSAPSLTAKEKWGNAFIWEMTRHALGEELVVYTALGKHLGSEGRHWAAKDRKDAQHLKESLYGFDHMSLTNPHREVLLDVIWGDFSHHAREEEEIQLPKLEIHLGDSSHELARSFEKTKRFTATRSHPLAPNEVPYATFAAFLAMPYDKLRDLWRSWPDDRELQRRAYEDEQGKVDWEEKTR